MRRHIPTSDALSRDFAPAFPRRVFGALALLAAASVSLPSFAQGARGWLGVEMQKPTGGGVELKRVMRGSPASAAGLVAGDIVVAADGLAVEGPPELAKLIATKGAPSKVRLGVRRAGKDLQVVVTLVPFPGDVEILKLDKVGTFAPTWKGGTAAKGKPPSDLKALKGRVVLLDFWASWCSACRASVPMLVALDAKHSAKGLTVLGLTGDTSKVATKSADKLAMSYGVLADVEEATMSEYGVRALPTMLLVDKKGVIRDAFVGIPDEKALESAITALLREI